LSCRIGGRVRAISPLVVVAILCFKHHVPCIITPLRVNHMESLRTSCYYAKALVALAGHSYLRKNQTKCRHVVRNKRTASFSAFSFVGNVARSHDDSLMCSASAISLLPLFSLSPIDAFSRHDQNRKRRACIVPFKEMGIRSSSTPVVPRFKACGFADVTSTAIARQMSEGPVFLSEADSHVWVMDTRNARRL
jgi:hypothetical protein